MKVIGWMDENNWMEEVIEWIEVIGWKLLIR